MNSNNIILRGIAESILNDFKNKLSSDRIKTGIGLWCFRYLPGKRSLFHWALVPIPGTKLSSEIEKKIKSAEISEGEGSIGFMMKSKRMQIVKDTFEDPRSTVNDIDEEIEQKSALCYPIINNNDLIGAFDFFCNERDFWKPGDDESILKEIIENGYKNSIIELYEYITQSELIKLFSNRSYGEVTEDAGDLGHLVKSLINLNETVASIPIIEFYRDNQIAGMDGLGVYFPRILHYISNQFMGCSYKYEWHPSCPIVPGKQEIVSCCYSLLKKIILDFLDNSHKQEISFDRDIEVVLFFQKIEDSRNESEWNQEVQSEKDIISQAIEQIIKDLDKLTDEKAFFNTFVGKLDSIAEVWRKCNKLVSIVTLHKRVGYRWELDPRDIPELTPYALDFLSWSNIQPLLQSLYDNHILDTYEPLLQANDEIQIEITHAAPLIHKIKFSSNNTIDFVWHKTPEGRDFVKVIIQPDWYLRKLKETYLADNKFAQDLRHELGLKVEPHEVRIESLPNYVFKFYTDARDMDPIVESSIHDYIKNRLAHYCAVQEKTAAMQSALKSAVAAIMTRNGSHNLGSHVLSAVTQRFTDYPDDQHLFRYIQERMDYLATVTTEYPQWTYPAWFLNDIMRRFYSQRNLLNFIGKSEGLSATEYQKNDEPIDSKQKRSLAVRVISGTLNDSDYSIDNIHEIISLSGREPWTIDQDFQISVPGGVIGYHAFYTILENIIRNSAKHGWAGLEESEKESTNLMINVNFDLGNDSVDYTVFRIWDNISRYNCLPEQLRSLPLDLKKRGSGILHFQINDKITQSVIDHETGALRKENWGIAEIKISAGFISGRSLTEIDCKEKEDNLFRLEEGKCRGIIRALPIKERNEDEYHLGYEFAIPKPKDLIIIGNGVQNYSEGYNKGIYYYPNGLEEDFKIDAELSVYIDDNKSNFVNKIIRFLNPSSGTEVPEPLALSKEIEQYPYRVIIVSSRISKTSLEKNDFLNRRIVLMEMEEFSKAAHEGEEHLKLFIYSRWIKHLKKSLGINDADMFLYLEPGKPSGDQSKEIELNRLVLKLFSKSIAKVVTNDELKSGLENVSIELMDSFNEAKIQKDPNKSPSIFSTMSSTVTAWLDFAIVRWAVEDNSCVLTNGDLTQSENYDAHSRKQIKDSYLEPLVDDFKKYKDLLDRTMYKYDEAIETLPTSFRAVNTGSVNPETNANGASGWDINEEKYAEIFDGTGINLKIAKKIGDINDGSIVISYNRHDYLKESETRGKIYFNEAISGAQSYFKTIESVPTDLYLKYKVLLQLAENALIRILIIDERVAQFVEGDISKYYNTFKNNQIYVATHIKKEAEHELALINDNDHFPAEKRYSINLNIMKENYDFVIIHQGVLDKLYPNNKNKEILANVIEKIKQSAPFVVVTSGRGEPENRPENAKFIAFSNIESFLLKSHPEKYLITQLLLKLINQGA